MYMREVASIGGGGVTQWGAGLRRLYERGLKSTDAEWGVTEGVELLRLRHPLHAMKLSPPNTLANRILRAQ